MDAALVIFSSLEDTNAIQTQDYSNGRRWAATRAVVSFDLS
jgi:hypothetical protein